MTTVADTQHPTWCRTHDPVGDNGEPTHTSHTVTVTLTDGEGCYLSEPGQFDLLRAELFWDEHFTDAGVWIASGRADEILLGRTKGEQLADNLEAFARQLRDLCKHMPAQDEDTEVTA
jgi:hypothetical protein